MRCAVPIGIDINRDYPAITGWISGSPPSISIGRAKFFIDSGLGGSAPFSQLAREA
jgi:hypothetical protein